MISFFIPGEPPTVTAQQKGYSRRTDRYYKPAELRDAEQKYIAYAGQYRPEKPLEGPVAWTAVFMFAAGKQHRDMEPKTTRPDTDNMIKALKDALSKCHYWHDDAQVADERIIKIWSDVPGIMVRVGTWDERSETGGAR